MAIYKGKDGAVTFTPAAGTETAVGELTAWEIAEDMDEVDGTTLGMNSRRSVTLFNAWSGNVSGFWDWDDTGQTAAAAGLIGTIAIYPEGRGAGNKKLSGPVVINGRTRGADKDGIVALSLTFKSRGDLTEGVDV